MEVKIYCIEDINDLKYVGSTKNELQYRLRQHIRDKRLGRKTSSKELNLYNSIIYELETCHQNERREREKYWINNTECVNRRRFESDDKDKYLKDYYQKNAEKMKDMNKEYYHKNKEKRIEYNKEYYLKNKEKLKEYYLKNKEKIKQRSKEQYLASKHKDKSLI